MVLISEIFEVDLSYPYNIRQKTKHFPLCAENKTISKDDFDDFLKKTKPKDYITHKKSL